MLTHHYKPQLKLQEKLRKQTLTLEVVNVVLTLLLMMILTLILHSCLNDAAILN